MLKAEGFALMNLCVPVCLKEMLYFPCCFTIPDTLNVLEKIDSAL